MTGHQPLFGGLKLWLFIPCKDPEQKSCEVGREGWQGRFISDCNGIDAFNRWFSPNVIAFKLVHRTNEKKLVWESDSIIMQAMSHHSRLCCAPTRSSYHVIENHLFWFVSLRCRGMSYKRWKWKERKMTLSGKTVAVDKMATLRNINEIFHLNNL